MKNFKTPWKTLVVDADDSVRVRLEGVPYKYHEDHISARGRNSLSHYNLVHRFIPMPEALKNSRCEGCSRKRMGHIGENTGIADDESQKHKRGDRRSKEYGQESSFRVIDGSLSSQEFGVGASM